MVRTLAGPRQPAAKKKLGAIGGRQHAPKSPLETRSVPARKAGTDAPAAKQTTLESVLATSSLAVVALVS
jgi:hypothetical protein